MKKKVTPVDYTNRDFETIKKDLVLYAKRYYPNSYKDFNSTSFGSLMLDAVAYIGDSLSFYLDYNANESFLETSLEYNNVINHAKQMGYKFDPSRSSTGTVDFYIPVPADESGLDLDLKYIPKILKGSTLSTKTGVLFTTVENVNPFVKDMEVVGSEYSTDGSKILYFVLKATIQVVSGEETTTVIKMGSFTRFAKATINDSNVSEIISVTDSNGNNYYEVEHLTQNIVYKPVIEIENSYNKNSQSHGDTILKAYPVPRRFVVEKGLEKTDLVFGFGAEDELENKKYADPSEVSINLSGKEYISNSSFDPNKILLTDKLGITPVNTVLTIDYRRSSPENLNAAVGQLTRILDIDLQFESESTLDVTKVAYIKNNLEVYNEEPINGDISLPSTEEIKRRAYSMFAMQGRAVTMQDYISATYAMPSTFGTVKRCAIKKDIDDYITNLNLFVVSENSSGNLEKCSSVLKNNLKTWLNSVRMLSDSIDIFDAKIINIGIDFEVKCAKHANKTFVLSQAKDELFNELSVNKPEIGEPVSLSEIYSILMKIDDIIDVVDISLYPISDAGYSDYRYDVENNLNSEGNQVLIPHNTIWEIKNSKDILGTVR